MVLCVLSDVNAPPTAYVRKGRFFARSLRPKREGMIFGKSSFGRVFAAAALVIAVSAPVRAQTAAALERAQTLMSEIAEPIFLAAEIPADQRFRIEAVDASAPKAVLLSKDRARVTSGLLRIVKQPEELAAAIAWLVAIKKLEGAPQATSRRFRMEARPPDESAYSSTITNIDEAFAKRSEEAATDVLQRQGNYGPDMERLRARARRLNTEAVKLLRQSDISSHWLISLYERMAEVNAGLLDRHDYAGREILDEQLEWLRRRTEPAPETRTAFWEGLDAHLAAIQSVLAQR